MHCTAGLRCVAAALVRAGPVEEREGSCRLWLWRCGFVERGGGCGHLVRPVVALSVSPSLQRARNLD